MGGAEDFELGIRSTVNRECDKDTSRVPEATESGKSGWEGGSLGGQKIFIQMD